MLRKALELWQPNPTGGSEDNTLFTHQRPQWRCHFSYAHVRKIAKSATSVGAHYLPTIQLSTMGLLQAFHMVALATLLVPLANGKPSWSAFSECQK
jgi:hypothetical protein